MPQVLDDGSYKVLKLRGEARDAAMAAVAVMEDCPLFNACKGAVFDVAGKNEPEASLMHPTPPAAYPTIPATRRGASATLVTRTGDPSHLVRALYLAPSLAPHPMLSGVCRPYFWTEIRWRQHRTGLGLPVEPTEPLHAPVGRVDDTSIMGSGFWAEERARKGGWGFLKRTWGRLLGKSTGCGVGISGTGDGDAFIRRGAASTIARHMEYLHESVEEAALHVVDELFRDGSSGGVIALDRQGNVALPLNCDPMFRGVPCVATLSGDKLSPP